MYRHLDLCDPSLMKQSLAEMKETA